ncbi:unnamed protein product [Paramecium primaurelia]|uniref:Glutathione transferase n=1 Tax=Paramecium primaurelia TaxID=5886 RepID=A0A8S1L1T3_PARPR|nr:unnamed protein product [Paramecium primaurelia]
MIKLYIDWISQPSRAVKAVLDILKVPHEVKALKIQFDEHKSPEFTAIHPLQQLPLLQDGDFTVAESHNIMRYIIKQRNISTNLYPLTDIRQQTRIDQYLDYHHTNTRRCLHLYHSVLISPIKGEKVIPEVLEKEKQDVAKVFQYFESNWLKGRNYICGDQATLADISACCEMMQLDLIKFDFQKYPITNAWLNRVIRIPEVYQAHHVAFKIIKKQNPSSQFLK